jgi:uncharacterized membrane protein
MHDLIRKAGKSEKRASVLEILKSWRRRIRASEAMIVVANFWFLLIVAWVWISHPASTQSAHSAVMVLGAGLVLALIAVLFAYLRFQRLTETQRKHLAETQARSRGPQ